MEITAAHGRHLRSTGFVVVHQTRRAHDRLVTVPGMAVSHAARAAVDVAVTEACAA